MSYINVAGSPLQYIWACMQREDNIICAYIICEKYIFVEAPVCIAVH